MIRFIVSVCMAFVPAFVAVTWASRGFPMQFSGPVRIAPPAPTVTATFGDQTARDHERKAWEAQHTNQSDKNPRLDKIRLETLQAANAYAMSPCDSTMKSNLIEALTAYTRAWQEKLKCSGQPNMRIGCPTRTSRCADTYDAARRSRQGGSTQRSSNTASSGRLSARCPLRRTDVLRPRPVDRRIPALPAADARLRREPRPMNRAWLLLWAVVIWQVASWTFAPPAPPAQIPEANRGKAFGSSEDIAVQSRIVLRQSTFRTLEQPWGGRCAGEGRKAFIAGLGHYYYVRQNSMELHPKYFGELGAAYIAKQWSTTDDQRIDRLTQEAYAKGYLKPADFDGPANKMVATVVKDERVTGKACAG